MSAKRGVKKVRWGEDQVKEIEAPKKSRKINLFNAVAGRAGYESLLRKTDQASKYRDTQSNSRKAIPPEEVLFRRKRAPTRYEENDPYFANEKLNPNQKLPNSDLLGNLHSYASSFYHTTTTHRKRDWKSMDETALLALGILVEEMAKHHLGKTGDLAFLESPRDDSLTGHRQYWNGQRWVRSVIPKKRKNPRRVAAALRSHRERRARK